MIQKAKRALLNNLKNIPGWRTKRKIIVFECDDWGGIRMPSKTVFDKLYGKGLKVSTERFNKYDTLANEEDLNLLFNVLNSVRDINSHPAVMTPLTVVANPDFEKIEKSGFETYFCEPFTETLKSYYSGNAEIKLWQEGFSAGIFTPELHGRDHIAVQLWMKYLKDGNKDLLEAFKNRFVALEIPGVPLPALEFRAEYYFNSEDQKPFLMNAIRESVGLYKNIFGFDPHVFVPGNGIFHPDFDIVVSEAGIKFLNVYHSMPYPDKEGNLKYRHFINGQNGLNGLKYYIRNCAFEPTDRTYGGIESTLNQIEIAFRWGKIANISTHRVNFVGGICDSNRKKGLSELQALLKAILKRFPEVEFMSSREALDIIQKKK